MTVLKTNLPLTFLMLACAITLIQGDDLVANNAGSSNVTYYCPDPGDIELNLSVEYRNKQKKTLLDKTYKSVSEMLEDEVLQAYNWCIVLQPREKRKDCFQMDVNRDIKKVSQPDKIAWLYVTYRSGKNLADEVTLTYDVENDQSRQTVKQGNH